MVFEKLRAKMVGRVEPTPPSPEAIHAHVLGTVHPPGEPPFPPAPAPASAAMPRGRFGAEFEGERPLAPSEIEALRPPSLEEPPAAPETPVTPPREFERRFEERGMYELIDRLAVIEAQLATIRAQTETLNERMKTIEMYIRSRMPRPAF